MFLTECEFKNLSPLTVKTYKMDIGYLIDFLEGAGVKDTEKLSVPHLKRWVVEMQKRPKFSGTNRETNAQLSAYTVNKRIRSVKVFLSWAFNEEYISKDVSKQFKKIKQPVKIVSTFNLDVVKEWLEGFDLDIFTGHRNYLIISTLLDCGLRISEMTGLKVTVVDLKECYLTVMGKGSK